MSDFQRARQALAAAGFTNAQALDLLTKRYELRDRFAIAALQGTLAAESHASPDDDGFTNSERAAWCFAQADAMLDARQHKGDDNAD